MRDPIKDMYKTVFDDYTVRKDGGEWEAMESRLQKQNFQHFRWTHFNIYYAVSIITTLFLSSAVAGHYFYSNFIKDSTVEKVGIVKDIKVNKPMVINEHKADNSKIEIHGNKASRSTSALPEKIVNKASGTSLNNSQKRGNIAVSEGGNSESVSNVPESISGEPVTAPFVRVQKVVIVKQDTIHQVDTIKTKGRFWKRH